MWRTLCQTGASSSPSAPADIRCWPGLAPARDGICFSAGRRRRQRLAFSAQIDGSLEWLAEHRVRNSNRVGLLENGQSLVPLRFSGCLWHVGRFFLTGDESLYSRAAS